MKRSTRRPSQPWITVCTYGVLALSGAVSLMLPDSLPESQAYTPQPAMSPPSMLRLTGVVRDFHKADATFAASPSGGNGHSAGSLLLGLDSNGRPAYSGLGRKVNTQWKDSSNQSIAPHLSFVVPGGPNAVAMTVTSTGAKKGKLDSWKSSVGPYGGANVGPEPTFTVVPSLPATGVPSDLAALSNLGDVSASDTSVSGSIHCDRLDWSGTITINGHVRILCEDVLAMATHTKVQLNGSSTLTLYLRKGASSWNHTEVNVTTKQPWRVMVYNMGTDELMIHNHAEVYATLVSPNAQLSLTNHGSLYGRFYGKTIDFGVWGHLHHDSDPAVNWCGDSLNDTAGAWGSSSNGGIPSEAAFADWFRDVPGKNLSSQHVLELQRVGSIYEYLTNNFNPIDATMFGEEGEMHNNYYTYAIDATFEYDSCAGQFFEFKGNDDAWVFVNGVLVMDLGGLSANTEQYIDMDRLGLTGGETYSFKFFLAQRSANNVLRMRTNINLFTEEIMPTISAAFD